MAPCVPKVQGPQVSGDCPDGPHCVWCLLTPRESATKYSVAYFRQFGHFCSPTQQSSPSTSPAPSVLSSRSPHDTAFCLICMLSVPSLCFGHPNSVGHAANTFRHWMPGAVRRPLRGHHVTPPPNAWASPSPLSRCTACTVEGDMCSLMHQGLPHQASCQL